MTFDAFKFNSVLRLFAVGGGNVAAGGAVAESRKRRWDDLNQALTSKRGDTSSCYSSIAWESVKDVFNPVQHLFVPIAVDSECFALVMSYLKKVAHCVPNLDGKEAKRLMFITPIMVAVSCMLEGVTIEVEEDLKGNLVKANGRFEMMLVRGNQRVCIVEAKKEDMEQGKAQCLVGCEVAAELDHLNVVHGVVTTYENWELTRSTDDCILTDRFTLAMESRIPQEESLKNLVGKICGMLAAPPEAAKEDLSEMASERGGGGGSSGASSSDVP